MESTEGGLKLRDVVASRLRAGGEGQKPDISTVKKTMQDIDVVDQTVETAKRLAGTSLYQEQLQKKDDELNQMRGEASTLREQLTAAQIEGLKGTMESKIEQLRDLVSQGGNRGDIAGMVREIREAAEVLGLGGQKGSGLHQIQETLEIMAALSPKQKPLSEQVKDILDMGDVLRGWATPQGQQSDEGRSGMMQLELAKMQQQFSLDVERLKMEQVKSDRDFEIQMEQAREQRAERAKEIDSRLKAQENQTQMIMSALEIVGGAIAKAIQEGPSTSVPQPPRTVTFARSGIAKQASAEQAVKRGSPIEAFIDEEDEIPCESCGKPMFITPDAVEVGCAHCGTVYPIQRSEARAV